MLENRVRELRARFNMTQSDLAKHAGITRQTVGLIEKGDYAPSITLALKLAEAFDTQVEKVFWLEKEEKGGSKQD
ncbi:helix-turn-helix transcriptional regulator [Alteribacillus sp. HJP-4]|uniref:helix-turn-helix transcriptional regulator n=1 Tax=Alteribacillus sp. HJP-4 TaxID=2775394 RepID=UPI0035CCF525